MFRGGRVKRMSEKPAATVRAGFDSPRDRRGIPDQGPSIRAPPSAPRRTIAGVIPPSLLIEAYRRGVFPMGMPDGRGESVQWFSPDPRGVIPLESFHLPRRLARAMRAPGIDIRIDTVFPDVVRACAAREDEDGTWITAEIFDSYQALFDLGAAHSVEVWKAGALAGGLYGVAVGCAFFGESMFHHARDASKIALAALVEHLRARGFTLLDVQWVTPHLEQFGAVEISRAEYLKRLAAAVSGQCEFIEMS